MTYFDDVVKWIASVAIEDGYTKPMNDEEEFEFREYMRDVLYDNFWDMFIEDENDALKILKEMNWYDNWGNLVYGEDWDYINGIVDFAGTALINYVERDGDGYGKVIAMLPSA